MALAHMPEFESLAGVCPDCLKNHCHEREDGNVYVQCPTCWGRGRLIATETKTIVACVNCGGAGIHRCRCLDCHTQSNSSTGWM